MNKQKWWRLAKKCSLTLLSLILFFIAVVILCLGANAIPEDTLTPLPYTWAMIGIRLIGYVGFYYFYRSYRGAPLLISALAVSYESYLLILYRSAMEGLLW
ncbi:hypothetical protein [Shewanella colwelliana]|uniref:hypothetical protein n=1 Tax=Shewanella colwelliana TaxID=23 RepID=UPI0037356313